MSYLTDKTSQEDLLERTQYVDRLIEMIATSATPYNIAIFGEWGTGKSNILDLIKDDLVNKKKIPFVEFSAWKYIQDKDSLRRKLLIETRIQLGEKDHEKNLYEATTFERLDIARSLKLIPGFLITAVLWFGVVSLLLLTFIWLVQHLKIIAVQENIFNLYKEFLIVPGLGAVIPLISTILANIKVKPPKIESSELFEKSFSESIKRALIPWWFRYFPTFASKIFKKTEKNLLEGKRIVVLIDDLDRCPADKVIEILDALMTFFMVKNCIYVVAGDHKIIEQAIINQNKATQGKEKDYLDKIFQFSFPIPPLTQPVVESYIKEQLKELDIRDLDKNSTIDLIVRGLEWNPRKIKLILNSLRFLLLSTREKQIKDNKGLLLKSLILQKEFNQFFYLLTSNWQKLRNVESWLQSEDPGTISQLDQFTQNLIQQVQANTRLKEFLKSSPLWGSKDPEPFFTLTSKTGYREISIPDKAQFNQYALEANFGALRTIIEKTSEREVSSYLRSLISQYKTPLQEPQKSNVARSFIYCVDLEKNEAERVKIINEFVTAIAYPGIQTITNIPGNEIVTLIKHSGTNQALNLSQIINAVRRFTDFNIFNNLATAFLQAQDILTDEIYNLLIQELLRYLSAPDPNFRNIAFSQLPQFLSIPNKQKLVKKTIPQKIYKLISDKPQEKHRLLDLLWQIKDLWIGDKRFLIRFKKNLGKLQSNQDPNVQNVANSILAQWQ